MEKIWCKQYQSEVPKDIDPNSYSSVVDLFQQSVSKFATKPAYSNFGQVMTYQELDSQTKHFAAYLQSLGLAKGDRVAIMMPNLLQYPVCLFGTLRAGCTVVNVNPLYTPRELKHQLSDSGAKVIVILENFANTFEKVAAQVPVEHVVVTRMGDAIPFPKSLIVNLVVKYVKKMVPAFSLPTAIAYKQALQKGENSKFNEVPLSHYDLAFLQYTGGTTGVAKGAALTHKNIIANVLQAAAWTSTLLKEGEEVVVTPLPLYHIFSLTANCLLFMRIGGMNYLITNPRDMKGFVGELKKLKFTAITGVNTLFNGLMNTEGFDQLDFSSLRLTLGGGMAVQKVVAERWQKITGVPLIEAYGLTETSPAACINPMNLVKYNGKIGLPIPSTEVSIQDEKNAVLPTGEVGELCIRGPQVMQGYWKKPEETAKVLTEDGWLHTGDIANMDEQGFVQIVDRKKDMILVSGFNVYPNEVESVVAAHEGVQEVGAIGVPDKKSTEAVKVVVVKSDPSLTEEALIKYCRENLAGYKVPKHVEFRSELPKTNVGKILRRALREPEASTVE